MPCFMPREQPTLAAPLRLRTLIRTGIPDPGPPSPVDPSRTAYPRRGASPVQTVLERPFWEYVMLITPQEVASALPRPPVLSTNSRDWVGLELQRYQHTSNQVELTPIRDHALVVRLAGQALFEERSDNSRLERHWTDSGNISLAPAGKAVSRVITGTSDILILHLSPLLVNEVVEAVFDRDASCVSLCPRYAEPDKQVDWLARLLLAEAENAASGSKFAVDMLARSLAVRLLRSHSTLSPRTVVQSLPITGPRLRKVVEFMRNNLSDDMPLSQLAVLGGLSQSHFARAFREAIGEPPHQYLIKLRVARARDLLENSALSIIEIALECGFNQPNHFASTFRLSTGMSPRAWRQARRS